MMITGNVYIRTCLSHFIPTMVLPSSSPFPVLPNCLPERGRETITSPACRFTLGADTTSQTNAALGAGAQIEGLLLNITTPPYSFMTTLKIDPPLLTAVLSEENGYYERA